MNLARWTLVILLGAIGVGALLLSASSTLALAHTAGVRNVEFATIAVLELSSIVGTVMWLRADSRRRYIEAALLVVAASAVAAIGGLLVYGLFGLVGPAFLVGSVHVASGEWRAKTTKSTETTSWSGPETVDLPVPVEPQAEPQAEPTPEPQRPQLESVGWSVDQIVADLHERGEVDARQRSIRNYYGVGAGKANRVLDALRVEQEAAS